MTTPDAIFSLKIADYVHYRKWVAIPLVGKAPIHKNWTEFSIEEGYNKCIEKATRITRSAGGKETPEIGGEYFSLGIRCGKASNLFVIDIDNKEDGDKNGINNWKKLLDDENPFPGSPFDIDTYIVDTGGGGMHYYFSYDDRVKQIRNNVGILPGIDIKTEGGQVVAPGCIHTSGKQYNARDQNAKVNPIPEWLLRILLAAKTNVQPRVQAIPIINGIIPKQLEIESEINILDVMNAVDNSLQVATTLVANVISEVGASEIEKVKIALGLLTDDYANNYGLWIEVCFALKNIANESTNNQFSDLWHEFSQRSKKYNHDACNKIWQETKPKEGGITIASLYYNAKKCNPEEFKKLFPKKPLNLRVKIPLPPYNVREPYYWYDYVREFHLKKYTVKLSSKPDLGPFAPPPPIPNWLLEILKNKIAKCARYIILPGERRWCYFKVSDKNAYFYETINSNPRNHPYRLAVTYEYPEDGKICQVIGYPSIYTPLFECQELWCNNVDFIPFHEDQRINVPKDIFNLFPGFAAKLVEWSDEKMQLIQPLLNHIRICWANNNEDYYKWMLQWLRTPLVTLTKTGKILILKGEQGCGKTMPFEFLRKYVYSPHVATIVSSFDDFLTKFNGIMIGKMLIIVDETASVTEGSMTKSQQSAFKSKITGDTIHVEVKNKEKLELPNHITYPICTNSDHCADLEKGSRREGVFECNPIYVNNKEYFNNLANTIMNQDFGDAFYTYLRKIDDIHGADYLPNIQNVPNTEIRQELIAKSRPKAAEFFDRLFDGEIVIPRDLIYSNTSIITDNKNSDIDDNAFNVNKNYYYVMKTELHQDIYKPWHKDFSTGTAWSYKSFADALGKYDKQNIAFGRNRRAIHGPKQGQTAYFSSKLLTNIMTQDVTYNSFNIPTVSDPHFLI